MAFGIKKKKKSELALILKSRADSAVVKNILILIKVFLYSLWCGLQIYDIVKVIYVDFFFLFIHKHNFEVFVISQFVSISEIT